MTRWRAAVVIAVVLATGCGNGQSSPPALGPTTIVPLRPLALQPGPHFLQLIGFARSTDSQYPPCEDFFRSHGGTAIRTALEITKEGDTWVGRSPEEATGHLELRFKEGGARISGVDISGGMTGSAIDMPAPPLFQSTGVRAWVQGTSGPWATVEGLGEFGVSFLRGRVSGDIRFGDGEIPSRCTAVMWSLVPDKSVLPMPPIPLFPPGTSSRVDESFVGGGITLSPPGIEDP
jgi:hypothetical protein